MATTPESLKNLYVALGGNASDVSGMSQTVEILNAISSKFEGNSDAVVIPDAIDNITAVVGNITQNKSYSTFFKKDADVTNSIRVMGKRTNGMSGGMVKTSEQKFDSIVISGKADYFVTLGGEQKLKLLNASGGTTGITNWALNEFEPNSGIAIVTITQDNVHAVFKVV